MRVLAIHRYYWPDTPPYASLLRSIAQAWGAAGHDVEVLAGQPSYKPEVANERRPSTEVVDGVTVRRVPMLPDRSARRRRVTNVVRFPALVARAMLRGPRHDVVMCSTVPPVLLGRAVSWVARRRGSRFVYHCMDLHPEIGALSGEFAHPVVRRVLARLDLATCRSAWRIVVLSEDMRTSLLRRDPGLADRIVTLTNFEIPDFDAAPAADVASPLPADPGRTRVVFAGNVGRFQGLEAVTEAVLGDRAGLDDVQLVLMGEGAAKGAIEALLADAPVSRRERVVLLPHGPAAAARALLGTADLGLVSLTPEVIRYAFPSKSATYLSEGVPLLVRVEEDSSLAALVREHDVGAWLPEDVEGIQRVILELAADRPRHEAMSERARELWRRSFSADELLPRWAQLLDPASAERVA